MTEAGLRADAERNRKRILVAAEALFLEHGSDVPLEEVAKHAKVGIGTLYRRFPTREALLAATSNERFMAVAEASRGRDADRDPGDAMREFLEDLAKNTSVYQSLAASLGTVIQHGSIGCVAITDEGRRLLRRAQEAGALRDDVTIDDIICMVSAIATAAEKDSEPTLRIAHLVDLLLSGLHMR